MTQPAVRIVRERLLPKLLARLTAEHEGGIPLYSEGGRWVTSAGNRWCDGFWPGTLWQAWALTGHEGLRQGAERATEALNGRDRDAYANFDIGFLFAHSFALGHRLTGRPDYRERALAAADRMLGCVSPAAGLITVYGKVPEDRSDEANEHSLIDVLGALSLLWWAGREAGAARYTEVALRQARMAAERQLRPDGTVWQQLDFDRRSGAWVACGTRHGAHVAGCWARAQAWAAQGFLTAAAASGDARLLAAGEAAVGRFLAALPEDGPPPWDLWDGPLEPVITDASALAIVAAALAKAEAWGLALPGTGAALERCLAILEAQLAPADQDGFLIGGSAYPQRGEGLDGATVWGDYFLLEFLAHVAAGPEAVIGFPLAPPG